MIFREDRRVEEKTPDGSAEKIREITAHPPLLRGGMVKNLRRKKEGALRKMRQDLRL